MWRAPFPWLVLGALLSAPAAFACPKEGCALHAHPAKPDAVPGAAMEREVDEALAGKCSCTNAGDCTCKKGTCKCPKCNHHRSPAPPLLESLQSSDAPLELPVNARRDATAGAFI